MRGNSCSDGGYQEGRCLMS